MTGRLRLARIAATAVALAVVATLALGAILERILNRVSASETVVVSPRAAALHEDAFVADLHADSLLWGRDLVTESPVGHVDFPRLRRGGVALQAFTVVTRVPRTINVERNPSDVLDLITPLAASHFWPIETWTSLVERALFQARRLDEMARRDGAVRILRDRDDLDRLVEARERDRGVLGALLGIEGAHALEGDLSRLDDLRAAGFRMIGLVHFFDNAIAGSAHGEAKSGLTDEGRELVARMQQGGLLVDVAHASAATLDDVLAISTRPIVASHTGVRATCEGPRNLSDEQIRGIAATGGVVAIGFWETAVCGRSARDVARAIVHATRVAGDDHVALGSDFDGAVRTPFDASAVRQITQALIDAGLPATSIRKVLGANVHRVIRDTLPEPK